MRLEYSAPRAESVCLQLEGVIADSNCPRIKNGEVWYEEYTTENLSSIVAGNDFLIF
jgi:hypothetical protein